jgi:hypothetical protein
VVVKLCDRPELAAEVTGPDPAGEANCVTDTQGGERARSLDRMEKLPTSTDSDPNRREVGVKLAAGDRIE